MADKRSTHPDPTPPARLATADGRVILYDPSLLAAPTPDLFNRAAWADAPRAPGYSGGRGATLFIDGPPRPAAPDSTPQRWVLRHYHRGGAVGRLFDDHFLWSGEARSRAVREFRLLDWMWRQGLPSPRPVAAHVRRRGPTYTADLLTVLIPAVEPLSTRLGRGPLPPATWGAVGACVRRFHDAGVWHADLTAHNLQIDATDALFLLDFDRGRRRNAGRAWRRANLRRLERSLRKISAGGNLAFGDGEWRALLAGYEA